MHYHLSFDVFGNDYVGFSSKKMQFQNSFFGIKVQLSASLEHFVERKPLISSGVVYNVYVKVDLFYFFLLILLKQNNFFGKYAFTICLLLIFFDIQISQNN